MRIFIPPEDIEKRESIRLSADKSHYLISVLRCRKGDTISIIDGKGKAYEAEVSEISKKNVFINVIKEIQLDSESTLNLVLCQGILKGEKMDLVIQKTTELGIKEIVPLITERCLVKETRKVKRWQKIAEEAAEQCGRAVIPVIHEPIGYGQWLKAQGSREMKGFIFWEEGGVSLKETILKIKCQVSSVKCQGKIKNTPCPLPLTPIFIIIGPEGGFTSEEVKLAEKSGLIRTTLGKRILRAETAAIVSVVLVQFLFEC